MEGETIFTINRNETRENSSSSSPPASEIVENGDENRETSKILCMLWKNGKLGAAYYNMEEKLLYVYEEMSDFGPQFLVARCLFREIDPKYLITFGNVTDDFIKVLIDDRVAVDQTTSTGDSLRSLPPNFFLLPTSQEYSYEVSRTVLTEVTLASHPPDQSNLTDKELYIQSLINFDNKMSVHAAGCLFKYIEKNWAFFLSSREELTFFHLHQVTMKNHVLLDHTTFNALHIFRLYSHDSGFKRGLHSSNREGLSIFKLFSSSCKSKLGQNALRSLLLKPLNDIRELNKRLEFITFVLNPVHREFVESLQDNIKNLAEVHTILTKIQNLRANARDWTVLYKAIYHTVFINELSTPYKEECALFADLHNSISLDLIGLENSIDNAIDFTITTGRAIIKLGLDESLDAKKLKRQDMSKHLAAAARVAVEQLPEYLNECSVVYLPEMGHLIVIKEWEPGCNPNDLQNFGFEFMFNLSGSIHYKNPLCLELDRCLGDVNAEIIAHENRILQRLSGFVLKYNADIRKPLHVAGLMDALISMAKVAAENGYVKPTLNVNNTHEVQGCRHPLMELVAQFEPNDFYSGQSYSRIKVITGPNGSGKSIYLKQVALVLYLAHVGSYVPAKRANIGMLHSVYTRMQAFESASVRLSAFMIDIIQALHNARFNSLILLDEFGRGTTGDEGFALLAGTLKKFYKNKEDCPHILVSTHYQKISKYLPQSPLVAHMKMTHTAEAGGFSFLFKIKSGVSSSYALEIAGQAGLEPEVIERANEILQSLRENTPLQPLDIGRPVPRLTRDLDDFLSTLVIPEPDD